MNIAATLSGDARLRPVTNFDFAVGPLPVSQGLQYVRASALAQARLQLAILSGDRRRALREIDRLVEIDRQLARVSGEIRPMPAACPARSWKRIWPASRVP